MQQKMLTSNRCFLKEEESVFHSYTCQHTRASLTLTYKTVSWKLLREREEKTFDSYWGITHHHWHLQNIFFNCIHYLVNYSLLSTQSASRGLASAHVKFISHFSFHGTKAWTTTRTTKYTKDVQINAILHSRNVISEYNHLEIALQIMLHQVSIPQPVTAEHSFSIWYSFCIISV